MKLTRKPPGLQAILVAGVAMLSLGASAIVSAPVHAQLGFGGIVYDPSNYAQNVLTAARTLEQINNQIRMLQNQATQLINEARNLQALPLTVLEPLQQQIRQTQQLLAQAQGIAHDVEAIEREFARTYSPASLTGSQRDMVRSAEERWRTSVGAFEDALKVQAGAVQNIEGSRTAVQSLVTASQSATGALQAAQAGNQLLALQSQQLVDLTATMAAMGRAQSLDAANQAAAKAQAREQLRRFMVPGPRLRCPVSTKSRFGTDRDGHQARRADRSRSLCGRRAGHDHADPARGTSKTLARDDRRVGTRRRSTARPAQGLRSDGREGAVFARLPRGLGREAAALPRARSRGAVSGNAN